MQRRKWSYEEKYRIVKESFSDGADYILRKYNISPAMLSDWKVNVARHGSFTGVELNGAAVLIQLRNENEYLRRIVARQALELALRAEVIKNSSY